MKLKTILEDVGGNDVEDIIEYLEEFVDTRKGKLTNADVASLTSYLELFNDRYRKKVAALLGTSSFQAAAMASEIASGALIAYVDENDVPGFHDENHGNGEEEFDFVLPHHDEMGPSTQQLQNIENQASSNPSSYQNSPPAFKPLDGGCPPLSSLDEWTSKVLTKTSASSLIDSSLAAIHQPFIFVGGDIGRLFVGAKGEYHGDILSNTVDSKEKQLVSNVYYGGEYQGYGDYVPGSAIPGVVGRVGYNLKKLDNSLRHATMVGLYSKPGSEKPETIKEAIQLLLKSGYIPNDAYVNLAGNLSTVQEVVGGGTIEVSEQDRKRSELQAAYHVGTWPNGRRMTAQEKAALAKELGMTGTPMKKHPWQQAGENAGLLVPGQRWWAPTSESKGS